MNRYQRSMVVSCAIVAGITFLGSTIKAADGSDSEQVSKLLSEAKTQAYQLREDASLMESYSQSNADWEYHKSAVQEMRGHINAVGKTVAKLDDARGGASPWQMTAIDRIKPLLREIAANTEAVINAINQNPRRLNTTEYKDYIEANADQSAQLAELISDFVSYGNSKSRMDRLGAKLEVPRS